MPTTVNEGIIDREGKDNQCFNRRLNTDTRMRSDEQGKEKEEVIALSFSILVKHWALIKRRHLQQLYGKNNYDVCNRE